MHSRSIALGYILCLVAPFTIVASGQELSSIPEPNLQGRVNALVQQLHLRYALDAKKLKTKRDQVELVLNEWNQVNNPAPRDRQAIEQWLKLSLDSNMPGQSGRLPETPRFVGQSSIQHRTKPVAKDLASQAEQELTKPEKRSEWSRHPAAAPLEWVDPFADDQEQPEGKELDRGAQRRRAFRPALQEDAIHRESPLLDSQVAVNRTELTRRIHAYNASLRETNLQVLVLDSLRVEVLESLADELERLSADRRFIELYRASVPEDRLALLPEASSAEVVKELVRRKIDVVLQSMAEDSIDRQAIERVAERLARL